jgi:4-hydroxy-3-polyprenylbenzoate decarboxylase
MSIFDLREWIAAAAQSGDLGHVRGAGAELEIGAVSQLNYRRKRPQALLFDDIPGYQPGQRVLTSSLASPALPGMSPGLGPGLDDRGLVEALRGRPHGATGMMWAESPDPPLALTTLKPTGTTRG